MKKKFSFGHTFLVALVCCVFSQGIAQDTPPNILFIIGDDMGVDVLNGFDVGENLPATPNIDKLRSQGVTFTNVWAAPVCAASRASLLTGKYGNNNGVNTVPAFLDTAHTSVFEEINARTNNAYKTAVVGKWHLSKKTEYDHPYQFGVDYFTGIMGPGVDDYYAWTSIENGEASRVTEYPTRVFTDKASQWIKEQDQPWFMWLAHVAPHTPYHVPPEGTYAITNTSSQAGKYLAMIESLDYEIGRLLDSIPEETRNNTLIVFLGDNGTPSNVLQTFPEGHGKSTLYQGGIQVPLVVAGKGVSRINEQENALINISDLFATFTHVADSNFDATEYLNNSLSFKHLLDNSSGLLRNYNYMELGTSINIDEGGYTIRDSQYKLIKTNKISAFYDLENDPYETANLLDVGLSEEQQMHLDALEEEAVEIRGDSNCTDGIQNGNETGIDCGGDCGLCNDEVVSEAGSARGYPIVHSGVTAFYNENSIIETPDKSSFWYGQDAARQYNKPSYTNNGDGTITDNITQLMWEQDMGEKVSFVEAVKKANESTLGGHTDWRVPTIKELYSLILFTGQVKGESAVKNFIDENYFTQPLGNTALGEREIDAQTWTSTHYAGTTMNSDTTIFGVNFIDGRIKGYPKYSPQTSEPNKMYFRLVRGNIDYGKNLFFAHNNGTVTDSATLLMWQQADNGTGMDWPQSIEYCENLSLGGYTDWHLPTAKELHSLVDYKRSPWETSSPAIHPLFQLSEINDPENNAGHYPNLWTSSPHLDGVAPYTNAVYISFGKSLGKINNQLMDVHGAGAQRSDPKIGSASEYPKYFGPQGDVQVVYNHCLCVRKLSSETALSALTPNTQISVYPNPVVDIVYIAQENPEAITVQLIDMQGTVILQTNASQSTTSLDLSHLQKGLYLLVCKSGQTEPFVQKINKL